MRNLLLSILLSLPLYSYGQVVNIESDRGSKPKGSHGSVESSLFLQRGNVSVFQYQAGLRLDFVGDIHHGLIIGSTSHGENQESTFQNESYSHLRWTAMWWSNLGTEVFTQFQKDDFKLLTLRQLTGCGLRFTFLKELIAVGIGGMSDYEKIKGSNKKSLNPRGTSYLKIGKSWDDHIKGQIITYYQPLFNNFSDYRILTTGSIEFKINKVFSVVNELNYNFDTRPPESVVSEDTQIKIKFKIKW